MIYYQTSWSQLVKKRKGPKKGKTVKEHKTYETKSLTSMHTIIRREYQHAITLKCDTSIPWPFGVWAEVIAKHRDDR
jgi:hypothetical protein